ncbi:hypothetical protein D9M70_556610 [compost metagenome]
MAVGVIGQDFVEHEAFVHPQCPAGSDIVGIDERLRAVWADDLRLRADEIVPKIGNHARAVQSLAELGKRAKLLTGVAVNCWNDHLADLPWSEH